MNQSRTASVDLSVAGDAPTLRLIGDWTIAHYVALAPRVAGLRDRLDAATRIDLEGLGALDTAGVALLHELLGAERMAQLAADGSALGAERRALLKAVSDALETDVTPPAKPGYVFGDVLEHVGRSTIIFWRHVTGIAGFIGITLQTALAVLLQPRRWRVTSLVANLERTAFDAVPIVALLTFLVGAVVAFLGATVLADFGASIFTVNLIAYSFLREFGVLLTAIIVAGRTASSLLRRLVQCVRTKKWMRSACWGSTPSSYWCCRAWVR